MSPIRFYILIPLTVCFFYGLPTARAATSISLTETQVLTFPTVGVPSSGSVNLTISPLNSSTSGTGQIVAGTAKRGIYTLVAKGKGGVSISITIDGITSGNSGVTLSAFRGLYNSTTINSFPSSTLPLPQTNPGTPLYIGATVTANSTVPVGSYTGSYNITIFVQ